MKIISWNVNGLRAVLKRGFLEWLKSGRADIVCLQEIKLQEKTLPPELMNPVRKASQGLLEKNDISAGVLPLPLSNGVNPDGLLFLSFDDSKFLP